MNATHCKRCGIELTIVRGASTKQFCSTACSSAFWNEQTFRGSTSAERAARQLGPIDKVSLTDVQAAWLACAIDGEGTIGIWRQRRSKNDPRWRYYAAVSISNTNFDFIKHASNLVDGAVHVHNSERVKKEGHRVCYVLRVRSRAIPQVLEQILPHLIVKRKQAEVALSFCRAQQSAPIHTPSDSEIYEHFHLEMKALNKRGTS